jgi:hypothetical protein
MLDLQQIYNFLPAVYRIRDADIAADLGTGLDATDQQELNGLLAIHSSLSAQQERRLAELQDKAQRGPLKSLMSILAEQVEVLEESLMQSYDDLFIETCQEWVVPYIGDLLGVSGLWDGTAGGFSLRAAIADTIGNRRRKGTVSVIERIARDVTGWGANVVEYFQVLAGTQFMNHVRPLNLSMVDVRNANWRMLGTPFDPYAHRVDVRSIEKRLGKYNIPNIGIFLWRIQEQRLEQSPAYKVDDRRYLFDAIGQDTQLYTLPLTEEGATQRATPFNVPMPITRWMMRGSSDDHQQNIAKYFGPALSINIDGLPLSPPGAIPVSVCDLSDVLDSGGNIIGWAHKPANSVGVDPVLGRIAFPTSLPAPGDVHVDYCYGFSEQMGGGSYSRPGTLTPDVYVDVPAQAATLQSALNQVTTALADPQKNTAVIEIKNNEYYAETLSVNLAKGKTLEIRGGDGFRPVLVLSGDMQIIGDGDSVFRMDGCLVAGGSVVAPQMGPSGPPNLLAQLEISDCTLAPCDIPAILSVPAQPAEPRIRIEVPNVAVTIDNSIVGSIRAAADSTVSITDSIVDALHATEAAYAGPDAVGAGAVLTVNNSTIIGKVHASEIVLASNTLFVAELAFVDSWPVPVIADQLQQGCVRFCYVPSGSRVPRMYRCHPAADDPAPVFPAFTSLRFGDAGYCQLAKQSGPEILQGADDRSEMGVFHDLHQPQRVANLQNSLNDYLRFGLEGGVFYAS